MKRSIVAVLTCTVLLISAAACSMGGSDSGDDSADGGGGGGTLKVYAVTTIDSQMEALAEAYKQDSPDSNIEFTFGSAEELAQKIVDGESPDVFIARPQQVVTVRDAGKTQASPVLVGFDPLQIVTPRDNPGNVTGLDAFAEGSGVIIGLCPEDLTCGRNGLKALETAGITPGQAVIEPGGDLMDKIVASEIQAALLYRTQAVNKLKQITVVQVPEESSHRIDYQAVQINPGDAGAEFVEWIQNSKTAEDTLKARGLRALAQAPETTTTPRALAHWMGTPPATSSVPETVCVTGMHRSGTSIAARLIEIAGVDLGDRGALLPAGPDNPAGYWENKDIKELDDELLAHLGGSWDAPPVLEPGWQSSGELDGLRARAASVLERTFTAGGRSTIGWKDPRLALLLPFWQSVRPIDATIVVVRDPSGVASSLLTRNGIGAAQANLLWLRYLLAATEAHERHLVVRHRDLYERTDEVLAQMCRHLGRREPSADQLAAAAAHLDHGLLHHDEVPTTTGTPIEQMAAAVWADGAIDLTALDPTTSRAIRQGWLRAPIDGELLARARAKVVKQQETMRRRAAKAAGT